MLRPETPRAARKEISLLLNRAHDSKWHVDASGAIVVSPPLPTVRVSQFDELSKARGGAAEQRASWRHVAAPLALAVARQPLPERQ